MKKRIIICGAGEVGRHATELLATQGHSVTVVDLSVTKLQSLEDVVDVRCVQGSSCHSDILTEAGVEKADLLFAATNSDEFNLLTAALSKRMGSRQVVARIHHPAYYQIGNTSFATDFFIDHLICPEQLTSMAIIGNLEDPGVVAIERFAHNQIEMHRYEVTEDSEAIGIQLSDIKLPPGMRLAVIARDGATFSPVSSTVFKANDIVTLIGESKHFKSVQSMFHQQGRSNNNVAIMGGSLTAEWLAKDLKRRDFVVRLFETERRRAIELSEKHEHLTVLHADPTDPTEFKEEHLEECIAFLAVSDNDEHNILAALQAKQLGAPHTAAVIHKPTYLQLLESLGVDWPFSPRIVAAKELLKIVDDSPIKVVATLAKGVAEVYEIDGVRSGEGVKKTLRETKLPTGTFVAAIQRGQEVIVPGADSVVESKDVLIVIGPTGIQKELTRLFLTD